MPAAVIEINGAAGSNTDLTINTLVTLTNQDAGGEVTYAWSIVDQPDGTADALSGASGPSVTFTPKKEGTYLIRLVVNGSLENQVVAAVRHLKTRIRVPAGSETNEAASAPRGWATDTNAVLDLLDDVRADAGVVVGQAAASLVRGDLVRLSGSAVIKSGLPGQEVVPTWAKAAADVVGNIRGILGIVEGAVAGGNPSSGALAYVRLRGLFQGATVAGSPSVGAVVFASDTSGAVTTAAGTVRRVVARVVSGSGPWNLAFDGAGMFDDAIPAGSFVPTTRTLQGTSPIAIGGGYSAVDLSANRIISLAIASEANEDVLVRKAGAWTRLAAGVNGTYLGVTAGVVGYSTPPNTTYSAGTGLTLSTTTFSVNYGTSSGTALEGSRDALYVHIAGAENVTGDKTFTSKLILGAAGELQATDGTGPLTIYTFTGGTHTLGATTSDPWTFSGGFALTIRASSTVNHTRVLINTTGFEFFQSNARRALLTSGLHVGLTSVSRSSGEVGAQVGFVVGTAARDASAELDLQGVARGALFNRVTTAQRNLIATPATTLHVFNTTVGELQWYDGAAWRSVGGGGSPFYLAGAAGMGPGGSNPRYATITAMVSAMVTDGATTLSPRAGFFVGEFTENPTLAPGVFLFGLGGSRRGNTIYGRVDYQPVLSGDYQIAGLAGCTVIQTSTNVDAILYRAAGDAELWLDDVEAQCQATSASYAALHCDGSASAGNQVLRAKNCALSTTAANGARGLIVTFAEAYFHGRVATVASSTQQSRAIYCDGASLDFTPGVPELGAPSISGSVYVDNSGNVLLGHGTHHVTAALTGDNPLVELHDASATLRLGSDVLVGCGPNTVYHVKKSGSGTAGVEVQGTIAYENADAAKLKIDSGITYAGTTTTRPEVVELITGTATIAKATTLALVIPASASTFAVTVPDCTGWKEDRKLVVKYAGVTHKPGLTLRPYSTIDNAATDIAFAWNDSYMMAASGGGWLILASHTTGGGSGGGSAYTRIVLLNTEASALGARYDACARGYFAAAEHDLTGGRTAKLRASVWRNDTGVDVDCHLYAVGPSVTIASVTSLAMAPDTVTSTDFAAALVSAGDTQLELVISDANNSPYYAFCGYAEVIIGP